MKPEEHYQRLKLVAKEMCNYLQSVFSNIELATPPRVVSNNVVFTFETNIPDYDLFKWNEFTNDVETLLKDKFSATDYTTNVSLRDLSGRSNMAWKTCITGFIVTLTSTVKYEFENPLKSLSFRWGSSVKKTERVKDVTDVQSVMDKFVSMMNEKIAWALQQPGRRLPVNGYILVNYKQELDDNSYFTPVLVWECREDKIYAAAVDAVGYEYETKTNKFRKIGTSLDLNLLNGSNLYDFTSHQFNLEYQGDVMNTEYVTESIYNQMNKIDDKESLNEKYNVRTIEDVKKLSESGTSPNKRKLSKNDIIYRYNFGLPMSEEDILKIGTVEQHKENAERIHAAVLAIKKWDPSISVSRKKDWTSMLLFLRRGAKDELTEEERNELKAVISNVTNFKDIRVYGGDNYLRCNGFVDISPEVTEFINH